MSTLRKGIPSHAKKMFDGKIFEVWQWEQKMFDGSVEIFERLRRPNTAQVIAVVGDKILAQTEEQPDSTQPFSSLPGGRCDADEDPLVAAKRELLEETGYVSDDWVLWKEVNPVSKIEWTVYTFIARNCVYKQEPHVDSGEKITSKPVSFDDFLTLSDDPFFYSPELVSHMLRLRLNKQEKEKFRQALFVGNPIS
ncbi:MAG: NUDIX domain-containing protein [Patescibacteria group bacterium]